MRDSGSRYTYVSGTTGAVYFGESETLATGSTLYLSSNTYQYNNATNGGVAYIEGYFSLYSEDNFFYNNGGTNAGAVFYSLNSVTSTDTLTISTIDDTFFHNSAYEVDES